MKSEFFLPPAAVLLCCCLSFSVLAQDQIEGEVPLDNLEEEPAALDDVVVTASLAPLSARDVGSSITVITREEIEQRQVKFVGDLLRDVPGFNVSQAGGPGAQTQVRVRGSEANQVLVLIDGIRANDPAAADEFQWQYALTSDVERIEIVRGPQSSIWGSDAVAGVINIIRKKDAPASYLAGTAEFGSFSTTDLAVDGAWSNSAVRLRGGLAYYESDGITAALAGTEKDGTDNTTANLGLEWDITAAIELLASVQSVDASNQFDDFDFFGTGLPVDADRVTDAEQAYWRAELRFAPEDSIWSGNLSVNYTDTDNTNIYDGAFNSSTAAETLEFRGRASALLEGPGGGQHRFTAALDYQELDFSQRGIASDFGDPNQDQTQDITGLAGEYVGQPFDKLTWTLSARHDDNSDFKDINTWQVAGSYQLSSAVRLRGSYGTGSKTPTFTERYGFFEDFFIGNPDLKPEESRGWELGVDTDWLGGKLTAGLAYFDMVLEDEINGFVFDPAQGAFTAINREQDSVRKGVEVVLTARLLDSLSLSANYTYTDATEPGEVGNDLVEIRRPRNMASFTANWRFAQDRANLNLNLNYTGAQLDTFFDPQTFVSEQVELDDYLVADLAGAWRLTGSLELVARITNLTDEDYQEVLGFARPGRAYYGGIRGRFDF